MNESSTASAPIALFVHRRPSHTQQTLQALARNEGAHLSPLYVFADGARSSEEAAAVAETREVVRHAEGFASVHVTERSVNMGLAQSLIEGIDDVLRRHGRVIVIEDDIVTAPYFLRFVNACLEHYAEQPKVMHISGYNLPIRAQGLPEVALTRWAGSWGWATWSRAWKRPDRDARAIMARFTREQRAQFDLDCQGTDFWYQLEANRDGLMRTWAVFWYAHVFLSGGLCAIPRTSLVRNIGHDGSGVHSKATHRYDSALQQEPVLDVSTELFENPLMLARIQAYYRAHRPSRWRMLARKANRWLHR